MGGRPQVTNGSAQKEKGRRTGPSMCISLLPVGLADFMEGRYCAFPLPSTGFCVIRLVAKVKKSRAFKGRGQSTGRKSQPVAGRPRAGRIRLAQAG